jgi:hypothetical protein
MGFFGTNSLRCSSCNAPLRWRGHATVIECCYCKTHVVVQTGRVTQQPATVVASRGHTNPAVVAVAVLVPVAIIIAVLVTMIANIPRATPAEIAKVSLATSPEQLATQLDARIRDGAVSLELTSGVFREITFEWHTQPRDHVTRVTLEASFKTPTAVIQRAQNQLGNALRFTPVTQDPSTTELSDILAGGSDSWIFEGPAVTLVLRSGDYGAINVPFRVDLRAHRLDDPTWKDQIDALWIVLGFAAFDTNRSLDDHHRTALRLHATLPTAAEP